MKRRRKNQSLKGAVTFVVPILACFFAVNPLAAQNLPVRQNGGNSAGDGQVFDGNNQSQQNQQNQQNQQSQQFQQSQQYQQNQPSAALNIAPVSIRPPIPPPPETPQATQAIVLQSTKPPSVSQAWRIKAQLLFKNFSSLDKNSVASMHLQAGYANAFAATARALADAGVHLEAMSFSSGHMLISLPNERGLQDKAIIALKQASSDSDSSATSGTDVRLFCDVRNHALSLAQVQNILGTVDAAVDNSKNKPGAESL